jgi:hypothetical protein
VERFNAATTRTGELVVTFNVGAQIFTEFAAAEHDETFTKIVFDNTTPERVQAFTVIRRVPALTLSVASMVAVCDSARLTPST